MSSMKEWQQLGCVLAISLSAGCSDTTPEGGSQQNRSSSVVTEKLFIAVNTPLQYFTQRLVGEGAKVEMLVSAGIDPASWQPSLDQVLQLQQADLLIFNETDSPPLAEPHHSR